jgi:hypothetical protein
MSIKESSTARELYYQQYPHEEDEMEGMRHALLSSYLEELLRWYYRAELVTLTRNLPFAQEGAQAALAEQEAEKLKRELEELKAKLRASQIDPDTLK